MKAVCIVEFPSNLGLKDRKGKEPGVKYLPDWLATQFA